MEDENVFFEETKTPDNLIDVYKEMMALERTKAAIYSNLWTILVTSLAALFSIFLSNKVTYYWILLIMPFFIGVWGVFAIFNFLYLKVLRRYIEVIEDSISINTINNFESKLWFKDIFKNSINIITKKLFWILLIIPIVLLIYIGFQFKNIPKINNIENLFYYFLLAGYYASVFLFWGIISWIAHNSYKNLFSKIECLNEKKK